MGASAVLGMRGPKRASVLAVVPFNLKVNGMVSGFNSFEPSQIRQIHQTLRIHRIRITASLSYHSQTLILPMSLFLRFLRSIGRHRDGHLVVRTEEASAHTDQKDGSLPSGVSSSNQAPAAHSTQHPNQWARMRLEYTPIAQPTRS